MAKMDSHAQCSPFLVHKQINIRAASVPLRGSLAIEPKAADMDANEITADFVSAYS